MKNLSELENLLLEKGQITCADIDEALMEYVDGELSDTVCERMEIHMAECTQCKSGVKLYNEVIDLAKTLDSPFAEFDLVDSDSKNAQQENVSLPVDVEKRLYQSLNTKLNLKLSFH